MSQQKNMQNKNHKKNLDSVLHEESHNEEIVFEKSENLESVEQIPPSAEECRAIICPTCDSFKEAEEIRVRALAEMENFKKRLQKEKDEQMAYAAESVLADLIPSLDNLDLALQYGSKDDACQNTIMGVEMTRKLLLDAIKKHGLETFGQIGDAFDPELHEALSQETSDKIPHGHIVSVMQKGYVLKGRLLRSAKVSISQNDATQNTGHGLNTTV